MDLEFEIYKGKKYSSLLKDIVLNREDRSDTIEKLINDLREMVKSPNDAILIIPQIKECLDVTIKNDEQLIKLAAIIQRLASANSNKDGEDSFGLTQEMRDDLLKQTEEIKKEVDAPIIPNKQ